LKKIKKPSRGKKKIGGKYICKGFPDKIGYKTRKKEEASDKKNRELYEASKPARKN
jgi:hypothetical protein